MIKGDIDRALADRDRFIEDLVGDRAYLHELAALAWRAERRQRPPAPAAGTAPDFRTCVHEGGHVVCALAQRVEVLEVSVQGNVARNGHCDFDGATPPFDQAVVLLGGVAAVEVHQGCQVIDLEEIGADADVRSAVSALDFTSPGGAQVYLHKALDQARQIVASRWADVRRLADALQRRGRLTGAEVLAELGR